MLTLTLWNTAETIQHTIELYENVPINLNYQFQDVTDINKVRGSYSQTFRVPATKQNKDFFGSIDKPNIQDTADLIISNYSIKRKIKASLSYNSVPLMSGYIQIKAVYIQKKDFADIEIIFFGEVLDLARSCKEKNIKDLNTSTINHVLNNSNITQSWINNLKSGNIVYGMIDKGFNWSFATTPTSPWHYTDGLWHGELTPYVKAHWLVSKIIEDAGFTFSSTLFDGADFQKVFVPCYDGSIVPTSDDNDSSLQTCGAGLAADQAMTTSYALLQNVDTSLGGFDYGGNYNNTSWKYTAPHGGMYALRICLRQNHPSNGTASALLYKNGVSWKTLLVGYSSGYTDLYEFLGTGDYIQVYAKATSTLVNLVYGNVYANNGSWMSVVSASEALTGVSLDISSNLPDIKQIDFLMGLQKMYNLVFIPDKDKPKHLIIESFDTFMAAGTNKDWTNKIDYNKDVVITPTTDIQKNEFTWENAEGGDFLNVAVQDSMGRVYGRHRVEDTENDFANGTQKLQTNFAPYIMSLIPSSSVPIHRCIDGSGIGVQSPKCRLAYWNGLTSEIGEWWMKNDVGTEVSLSTFPFFSSYNAFVPSVTDNDLNFGYERAFIPMIAHPLNTMFYRFWMGYVNELYSADSRLVTLYVKLTRADIQDFEFSDRIFIKDTYYRILKISNYDAATGGIVQVNLIKILSDVADCADIPTGITSAGWITFNGGATDYGSQACCERYGYIWFPDKVGGNSRCIPRQIEQTPT